MLTPQQLSNKPSFTFFLAAMVAITPFSIDAYMPVLPEMAASLNTDLAAVTLTMSSYFAGLAIGQLIGGPLSDQLGRKTIGLTGLLLFIATSIAIASSNNVENIQTLRIFQAIGSGFASVICMAQVRDVYPAAQAPKKFANIMLVMLIAPIIAPPIGIVISVLGWQAIFVFLAFYGTLLVVSYAFFFPETNANQAEKFSVSELGTGYWRAISMRTNGKLIALRYAIFGSLTSGVFLAYLTSLSFIFVDHFGYTKIEFALLFGLNGLALMVGNRLSAFLMDKAAPQAILKAGNLSQISLLVMLILISYSALPSMLTVLITFTMITFVAGTIAPITSGHFIGLHEKNLGSASSLLSTLVFAFGALIGGVVAGLSGGDLLPIFGIMLFALLVANRVVYKACKLERQPII